MKLSFILIMVLAVALSSLASTSHQLLQGVSVSESDASCCERCMCTRSIPPQCRCLDVKSYCDKSCNSCPCTRSIPPQCRCMDIKDHCRPSCTNI